MVEPDTEVGPRGELALLDVKSKSSCIFLHVPRTVQTVV